MTARAIIGAMRHSAGPFGRASVPRKTVGPPTRYHKPPTRYHKREAALREESARKKSEENISRGAGGEGADGPRIGEAWRASSAAREVTCTTRKGPRTPSV